jgi:nicotinamide riboside transporter PnuC
VSSCLLTIHNALSPYKVIVPEGRINKMADLQETKFLRLFALTNCLFCVVTPTCNCLYLRVEQHQYYVLLAWHASHYFMLLDQIYLIMQIYLYALLAWCPRYHLTEMQHSIMSSHCVAQWPKIQVTDLEKHFFFCMSIFVNTHTSEVCVKLVQSFLCFSNKDILYELVRK